MHIIFGICLGLALLYFWLIGHWFARVVVFLMLVAIVGTIGGTIASRIADGLTAPETTAASPLGTGRYPYPIPNEPRPAYTAQLPPALLNPNRQLSQNETSAEF